VNLNDVPRMADVTLKALHQSKPQGMIKVLRLRTYAGMKQGVVISGSQPTPQFVFNAQTGQPG